MKDKSTLISKYEFEMYNYNLFDCIVSKFLQK